MITGEVVNFLWFIGNPYNTWFISNGLGDTTSGRFLAKTQRKAGFQILSLPLSDKRHLKTEWMRTSSQNVKIKLAGLSLSERQSRFRLLIMFYALRACSHTFHMFHLSSELI